MATKKAALKKAAKKTSAKKPAVKKSVAKKAPKITNLDRLVAADVIPQENIDVQDAKVINKLSAAEVSTLIKLRKKLGDAPLALKANARPNFPV